MTNGINLQNLSDDDLAALQSGDLSKVSDAGMQQLSGFDPFELSAQAAGDLLALPNAPIQTAESLAAMGISSAAKKFGGPKQLQELYKTGELASSLVGKGPGLGELTKRAGVPEGGRLSDITSIPKDSFFDLTTRGTVAGIAEAATPTFGLAARLAKPITYGIRSFGKYVRKSPLSDVDRALKKSGQLPISGVLDEAGIDAWTAPGVADKAERYQRTLGKQQEELISRGLKAGAAPDIMNAISPAQREAQRILSTSIVPSEKAAAEHFLKEVLPQHIEMGRGANLRQIMDAKTSLQKAAFGSDNPDWFDVLNRLKTKMQYGYRKESERALGDVLPDAKSQLVKLNRRYGTLNASMDDLERSAVKELRKPVGTEVSGMLAGAGEFGALGTKEAIRQLKGSGAKMKVGKFIENRGRGLESVRQSVKAAEPYMIMPRIFSGAIQKEEEKRSQQSPWSKTK